jgi:hypothetical protein
MEDEDIRHDRIAEIIGAVREMEERGDEVTYPRVADRVSEGARDIMTRIAALAHPPASLEEARGCLRALRAQQLQRQMGEIQKRLESGSDAADTDELLRRKVALKKEIEALRASP